VTPALSVDERRSGEQVATIGWHVPFTHVAPSAQCSFFAQVVRQPASSHR
jgi:hypothetical protein